MDRGGAGVLDVEYSVTGYRQKDSVLRDKNEWMYAHMDATQLKAMKCHTHTSALTSASRREHPMNQSQGIDFMKRLECIESKQRKEELLAFSLAHSVRIKYSLTFAACSERLAQWNEKAEDLTSQYESLRLSASLGLRRQRKHREQRRPGLESCVCDLVISAQQKSLFRSLAGHCVY
eukprot:1156328-Pelagomonas_calceolata.AAC.4